MVSQYDEGPEEEGERGRLQEGERSAIQLQKSGCHLSDILIEAGVIVSKSIDEEETIDEGPTTEGNAEPTSSIAKKKTKTVH